MIPSQEANANDELLFSNNKEEVIDSTGMGTIECGIVVHVL